MTRASGRYYEIIRKDFRSQSFDYFLDASCVLPGDMEQFRSRETFPNSFTIPAQSILGKGKAKERPSGQRSSLGAGGVELNRVESKHKTSKH